ncbi:hypothetical protein B0H14DRAFT_2926594 [Mycena olivaceomarginata]|nr:hypothetical protein B0H14DRAFT_2926594 [Mycena olivaceomarginata]
MRRRTVYNKLFGGVGGPGGDGHSQGTGGNGGNGEGPTQHYHSENSTVNNVYGRSAEVLSFLLMIALVGGIIAHAIPYSNLVSCLSSSQGQTSSPVPQVNQTVNNCPPPSRIFHGRQNILDKMHKYFGQNQTEQHIFLLYGVGGAGKTQIALKFIQASSCFSDSFYIDASTWDTIEAGLKNIALIKAGNTSQDALNWLQGEHDQWLLFFDNADDPEIDLNPFLPRCDHGNIIIASRNPALRFYAGSDAHVSDMEETDAVKLLLTRAAQDITPHNEEMAAAIVEELSCLPLAIIQAGAFIAESGALHTYLGLYKQNRDQLLSKKPAQAHDEYNRTVYTTWQISFDRLSELAQTFLQLCSFLHHRGISEKLFSKASGYKFPANGPSQEELQKPMEFLSQYLGPIGDWDSLQFTEVTNQLRAYSLIDFDPTTSLFSIHRLVHSWSQSTLTDVETYHYSMVAILGMTLTNMEWEAMQLVPHLLSHLDSLRKGQAHVTPDFNTQYGCIYYYSGRPKEAAGLQTFAVESWRAKFGEDHPETLIAMANLARTYSELGKLKKAQELEVKSIGENHPDTLKIMGNLARTYHGLHRWDEAEKLEVQILEKQRESLGEDHPDTLKAMANLASTYNEVGKLSEAEKLGVLVVEKRREILGDDHTDTLQAISKLAMTYGRLGRYGEAEKLQFLVLNILVLEEQRKIYGEENLDTLKAMANLAVSYHELGRFGDAEKLEVLVLKKRREILGENHPDTLSSITSLARTYHGLGRVADAEKLRVLVFQKRREILGENHADTLVSTEDLAKTYQGLGRVSEAENSEDLVLKKMREILGENHPATLYAAEILAESYCELGEFGEAEKLQFSALEKRKETFGEDHPDTLRAMGNLALIYSSLGRFRKAEKLQVLVLDKQRKILAQNHPDTLVAMEDLAMTYSHLGMLREVEKLLVPVLDKKREIFGVEHPQLVRVMKWLQFTYQALGKSEKAQALKMHIEQIEGCEG